MRQKYFCSGPFAVDKNIQDPPFSKTKIVHHQQEVCRKAVAYLKAIWCQTPSSKPAGILTKSVPVSAAWISFRSAPVTSSDRYRCCRDLDRTLKTVPKVACKNWGFQAFSTGFVSRSRSIFHIFLVGIKFQILCRTCTNFPQLPQFNSRKSGRE